MRQRQSSRRRQAVSGREEEHEGYGRRSMSRRSRRRPEGEHEDLRKLGPFNVDRSPSGRLVPKGSIDNPIDRYPDSKTKL
jgi:hypothetical protein